MNKKKVQELLETYRNGLLDDTLPFWIERCVDNEYGGFMCALDRDGSLLDTDKSVWQHGRFTWLLAHLYNNVEKNPQWLKLAEHGIEFILKHCFDSDGRMFFTVTREGKALRKRRYLFSEAFGAIALAETAKATGRADLSQKARELFDLILKYLRIPGLIQPKVDARTRPAKGLAVPMIMIVTAQILRNTLNDTSYTKYIDDAIQEIERDFMKSEFQAVLETVTPNGDFIDHFDGRMLCPGHSIEAAWLIMHEATLRNNDTRLIKLGTTVLDWMWEYGWDKEYGGILYFRDVKGLPVQEYWHDMKFWWQHNEAIIATLLAYYLTGDEKYAKWYNLVHQWSYSHFPDSEYGEWFGYLHRDGRISVHLKGNLWKGPFHLPRMQLYCWKLLEKMM
jgi:N-acylglucosamine 2-epimerase